jgi:predicted transcriptional regulator
MRRPAIPTGTMMVPVSLIVRYVEELRDETREALIDELRAEFDQGHFMPWEDIIERISRALAEELRGRPR